MYFFFYFYPIKSKIQIKKYKYLVSKIIETKSKHFHILLLNSVQRRRHFQKWI